MIFEENNLLITIDLPCGKLYSKNEVKLTGTLLTVLLPRVQQTLLIVVAKVQLGSLVSE